MNKYLYPCYLLFLLTCFGMTNALAEASHLKEGQRLWLEGKHDAAAEQFKKAIAAKPEDKAAYAKLAALYLSQNSTKAAIPAYQDAIMYDAENAKLFASLSLAYLHQQSYGMARAMASQALKLEPDLAQAKKLMKYIELKQEVLAKAATADNHDSNAAAKSIKHPHSDVKKPTPEPTVNTTTDH